jgi:hypothetical protein
VTDLLNIKEAADWASNHIGKNVTPSNISYLIQYGRVRKIGENGSTQIALNDLVNYYKSFNGAREVIYKEHKIMGDNIIYKITVEDLQYEAMESIGRKRNALWQKGYRYRKNDKTALGNPYFSKAPLVAGMNNPDISPLFPYFQQVNNCNYGYTI